MPTIPIKSSHNQRYSQRLQHSCSLSIARTPVTYLTSDFSKLAIQRGKSLHPSRLFPPITSKVSKLRKPGSGLTSHGGSTLTVLQDRQSISPSQAHVGLPHYRKPEMNNNIKNVPQSTQNHLNYRATPTYRVVTTNVSKPLNISYSKALKTSINNNGNSTMPELVDNKYRATSTLNINNSIQLLHPHWRKVPWISQFGWTEAHQRHCEWLQQQVRTGSVSSIFYSSPEEYLKVEQTWHQNHRGLSFLSGPCANSVMEVLDILHRTHYSRQQPQSYKHIKQFYRTELAEYDADIEDVA